MTLDEYFGLAYAETMNAARAKAKVVDRDGNELPWCDGCHMIVWNLERLDECVHTRRGLFFCRACAEERNLTEEHQA